MEPELIKKKNNPKRKIISIIAACAILLVVLVSGTYAYYQSSVPFANEFKTAKYSATVTEQFVSPDDWVPGDETDKDLVITNTGSICENVRVSYTEGWKDKNDNSIALEKNGIRAAIINLDNQTDWEYQNGYYYYKNDLLKGQSTSSFIKSVTFNPLIVNSNNCVTTGSTTNCTTGAGEYEGATYTLNLKVETVECDKKEEAWIEKIPIPTSELCSNVECTGSEQQLTTVTETDGYTLSNYLGTDVGDYIITATLKQGYKWIDETTENKTFTCSISQPLPQYNLKVKLTATGNSADRDQHFKNEVKLSNLIPNKIYNVDISNADKKITYTSAASSQYLNQENPSTFTADSEGKATIYYYLRSNKYIVIQDLYTGVEYTVTSIVDDTSYKTTINSNSITEISGQMNDDVEIIIDKWRIGVIPSGG